MIEEEINWMELSYKYRKQRDEARRWARKLMAQRDRETKRIIELLKENNRLTSVCIKNKLDAEYWMNEYNAKISEMLDKG